ncbi:MAG: PhoH-like ATPase, partial [Flavobacteriaceae bacterium]
QAEDYETGKIKNVSTLHTGKYEIENVTSESIDHIFKRGFVDKKEILQKKKGIANSYFILKSEKNSVLSYLNPIENTIEKVDKMSVYGIKPRNAEQSFAIHAMLNPNIKLISINGVAGTGKTLLALASALEQRRAYKQIYLARPIVPLSNKDIGYLPGDIKSKLNPYMEPLWDNLKFIQNQFKESDKEFKNITEMVNQEKLNITPLAYIRGRSLSNIFFIVDEAQNLTPHEIKTIITRAGENTKIVFTGDIYQIDTPYLDSQSNGLSYLIDRIQGHPMYAHITLEKGERSDLANLANELL